MNALVILLQSLPWGWYITVEADATRAWACLDAGHADDIALAAALNPAGVVWRLHYNVDC